MKILTFIFAIGGAIGPVITRELRLIVRYLSAHITS